MRIDCEKPNNRMNTFEGRMVLDPTTDREKVLPLNLNHLMLRGAELRNTEFIFGVCVYAGTDTKIMRNLVKSKMKGSTLQKKLNYLLIGAFVYNAIILATSIVLSIFWANANIGSSLAWYLGATPDASTTGGTQAMTYYILYTYVIPISLFISLELVRIVQGKFIDWDNGMYKRVCGVEGELKHAVCKNSNLNEELGVVDYIFSDKTGTLTQNVMKLSKWYVAGTVYDEMDQPGGIKRAIQGNENTEALEVFTRHIALCHSALPTTNEKTGKFSYESESPDETALLGSMLQNDIVVKSRNKEFIVLDYMSKEEKYDLMEVIEFSSDRKRQSVIVRIKGKIELLCKGADSIIFDRLNKSTQKDAMADIDKKLHDFSLMGLRTLVFAKKDMSEEDWQKFK